MYATSPDLLTASRMVGKSTTLVLNVVKRTPLTLPSR
jgi:hypothetical protein